MFDDPFTNVCFLFMKIFSYCYLNIFERSWDWDLRIISKSKIFEFRKLHFQGRKVWYRKIQKFFHHFAALRWIRHFVSWIVFRIKLWYKTDIDYIFFISTTKIFITSYSLRMKISKLKLFEKILIYDWILS